MNALLATENDVSAQPAEPFTALHDRWKVLVKVLPNASEQLEHEYTVERGTYPDYRSLSAFHYRRAHPGGVKSIYRIVHRAPTVVGRYLQRADESQIVGVLVMCSPHLACRLRDYATHNRYRKMTARDSAVMLNREVQTISRVIVDPRLRGRGLAVKLVQHALSHSPPSIRLTEALAAMARVSPFFDHAGMTRYECPMVHSRPHHARLIDALQRAGIKPILLASRRLAAQHVQSLDDERRQWCESELRRWYRHTHWVTKHAQGHLHLDDLLTAARDELLFQPVYYAYRHG